MARFALATYRFVQNASLGEGQSEYFDETTRGLALRVSKGAKAWDFLPTTATGTRKRLTLGTYPATSLSKARTLATEAKGLVEAGEDRSTITAAAESLKAISEEYHSREGSKLRTAQGKRKKTFNRLVYPTLGAKKIDAIRRTDIVRLLDQIEDERGPVMADKTLALLSKLFSWHASRSDDFARQLSVACHEVSQKSGYENASSPTTNCGWSARGRKSTASSAHSSASSYSPPQDVLRLRK